jgi:hypothetical protein
MIGIKPVKLGLPSKDGVKLLVRVLTFDTKATSCVLYYEVQDEEGGNLANGNVQLSEEQFSKWGYETSYLDDIVLETLGLEKI